MSKVVFKLKFKHPNFKDTCGKNIAHMYYIATRPGTDKTLTEADLKKELEKSSDYKISSDDETYLKYINERPRSHGLFGQDGIEDMKKIHEELSEVNSFVWRGIVSLKESDAKEIGYLEKNKWQDMLRKKIPDMADEMGIPITNLRWVGAVHMEKGHPHAHIMLWEKEPQRTIGVMSKKSLDNIRKSFTDEIFEEERFCLLNEKNSMRDLINDLAKGGVSKVTHLLKEVKENEIELNALTKETNQAGVPPRLYSDEEKKIAEMIQELAKKLPGKGRINLKFMSEDVKEEVGNIADYILKQPEMMASLEKNLKAVEKLTQMYTGKEDAIQKARDNAYKDIRDRTSQIILKGAVESQKSNIFHVDQELSLKAVNVIKFMNNSIDLTTEYTEVFSKIIVALNRLDKDNNQIYETLKGFIDKEEIQFSEENLKTMIDEIIDNVSVEENDDLIPSSKKIDYYLSNLKLLKVKEKEAFEKISEIVKSDSLELNKKLVNLEEKDILKKKGIQYKLTDKGIEEFLKVKNMDQAEKEIFKMLESKEDDEEMFFKDILENKDVFSNLRNKDPEEFKLGKYDTRVRYEFGENNRITLKDLENKIYEKYADNIEKGEQEFDFIKHRIDKLTLNGYVKVEKETGIYSFSEEVEKYFQYDSKKDLYSYTEDAIEKLGISKKMEFTRYDANVSLNYISKADNEILTLSALREILDKEVVNQVAESYYNRFSELMEDDLKIITQNYILIDDKGELTRTEEGKRLGSELNKLKKLLVQAGENINDQKVKELCNIKEFQKINTQFLKQTGEKVIERNEKTGVYEINSTLSDINKFVHQIHRADGSINKLQLKKTLEKNIPNREAEKQFKYLNWRLENLKKQGYLSGKEGEYKITDEGAEKRADILIPERNLLKNKLSYLERLGLIKRKNESFEITNRYYSYIKSINIAEEKKQPRESQYISKEIVTLIDRTQDKIDVGKIERTGQRIATGKYINDEYEDIKTAYGDIRSMCGIADTVSKTISNLSTTLLISGVSLEETKTILNEWNIRANNIDAEKLNNLIDKSNEIVTENNLWDKTTVISPKDWNETFKSLGIKEENIPKWIFKGDEYQRNITLSLVNDMWKGIWRELEQQKMQSIAQAEYMKNRLNKQISQTNNKAAMKEQMLKNKASTLYKDEELELN